MRSRLSRWSVALALALAAVPVAGQVKNQKQTDNTVTLIGCVEAEKAYRDRLDAKAGGPLATGLGQGNEFVLSSATPAPATGDRLTSKETVATAGQNGDYLLTGKPEPELSKAVGREIEVVGTVQPFKANDSAKDARDRLPRLTISTWHPVGDFCPAGKK